MYIIEATTAEERLMISNALGDAFADLERAHRMLDLDTGG